MQKYNYKVKGSDVVHTTASFKPRRNLWVLGIGCGFSSLYYTCFVPHSDRTGYHSEYEKAWDILAERVVRVHKLAVTNVEPCGETCKCYEHDPENLAFTESGKAYFPEQLEVREFFQVECVL